MNSLETGGNQVVWSAKDESILSWQDGHDFDCVPSQFGVKVITTASSDRWAARLECSSTLTLKHFGNTALLWKRVPLNFHMKRTVKTKKNRTFMQFRLGT